MSPLPMTRLKPLFLLGALCLVGQGCASVKYATTAHKDPYVERGASFRKPVHSLFWGGVSVGRIDVDSLCGGHGVYSMRTTVGPLGMFATLATLGLWTPSKVKVVCRRPVLAMQAVPVAAPAQDTLVSVIIHEDAGSVCDPRYDDCGVPLAIPGPAPIPPVQPIAPTTLMVAPAR